jgi:hypothetical protein
MPLRRSSGGPVGPASAPRAAAADPFAHAVLRSSAATGPGTCVCSDPRKPWPASARVMRRLDSSEAAFRYPLPKLRGPARTLRCVPAALMGFVPSQCCSCPRGFGGVVRPVLSHLPFRDASAPIIFVGGSAVPLSLDLDLATHVVSGDSRSGTRSPRLLGLGVPREQSVPSSRVSFGARLRLAAAETALGFASLRCSGRCRAARTGSTPFRAASLRKSASGSYPLVGFRLRLGWMCFADSSRDALPVGHNRPCSVLMRLTPSRSGFLSTRSRIGSLSEVRAPSVSLICFTFSRRGAQPN